MMHDMSLFGNISSSSVGEPMEINLLNTNESILDESFVVETFNESGDICLDIEENLIARLNGRMVESIFNFFDILCEILSDDDVVNTCEWRMDLLTRVGGRGSLHNLWVKLREYNLVKSRKRKCSETNVKEDDTEDDIEREHQSQPKRPRLEAIASLASTAHHQPPITSNRVYV